MKHLFHFLFVAIQAAVLLFALWYYVAYIYENLKTKKNVKSSVLNADKCIRERAVSEHLQESLSLPMHADTTISKHFETGFVVE